MSAAEVKGTRSALPADLGTAGIVTTAAGVIHPVDVVWNAERQVLDSGNEHSKIYQVAVDSTWRQVASTGGGPVPGLALNADDVL